MFCCNLYQLLPITGKPVFMFDEYSPLLQEVVCVELWRNIKITELIEVMLQKYDADFIHFLNKVRVRNINNNVGNVLKTCFISKNNPSYPTEAQHISAENRSARVHNQTLPDNLSSLLISIYAEDKIRRHSSNADIAEAGNDSQSEASFLALLLRLNTDAIVMITANFDIPNRLINGQVGIAKQLKFEQG